MQRDYLHDPGAPTTRWARTNAGEAITNSPTPMGWNLWSEYCSRGIFRGWADFGIFTLYEATRPRQADERLNSIFFGRPAANVDMLCRIADLTPGTDGDVVERQVFGWPESLPRPPARPRYLAIALKMPLSMLLTPWETRRNYRQAKAWWSASLQGLAAGTADPCQVMPEAARRFEEIMRAHARSSNIAGTLYQRLAVLAAKAGLGDDVGALSGGYGKMKDTEVLDDLWRTARGELTLDVFLARHGYHGPDEGEVSSKSWREDPAPIEALLASYAGLAEDKSPRAAEQRRITARQKAEAKLLDALPWWKRVVVKGLFRFAARCTEGREEGKAAFLMMIDVLRAAARQRGADLARQGVLDQADDVFFLTLDEATSPGADARATACARRERWNYYQTIDIPDRWTGTPEFFPIHEGAAESRRADTDIKGVGVSPGVAEGVVRVILSASDASSLKPGEILVCPFTDPSWGSVLFLSGGLVTDIGGPLSHGAIIAREVGVPCVVSTVSGTKKLRTGDRVRVDGGSGVVEILQQAGAKAAQLIYAIDHPHDRPPQELKELLGGKGANLAEMVSRLALPVPPGFTITTAACRAYMTGGWPAGLDQEIDSQLAQLEAVLNRKFGDPARPLIVSVRSGAAKSMPGMMDTILNLGLNDQTTEGLAAMTGNADFARDCHHRFLKMYREIVGVEHVPADPRQQLRGAIEAVFKSWTSPRAVTYRQREGIPHDGGTAVTVQAMVFGNLDDRSATGVCFSRDPATGDPVLYGDVLFCAQGEDVVAGTHATEPLSALTERLPDIGAAFTAIARRLEQNFRDLVDIEFTIESGKLWILQVRAGKRTPLAAIRIAHQMATDPAFKLTRAEAIGRVKSLLCPPPRHMRILATPPVLTAGLPASPGIATGHIALSAVDAEHRAATGQAVLLVREETSPSDVGGMAVAAGILTARGGLASHAAVVARGWGIPAVVGATALHVNDNAVIVNGQEFTAGDELTIDGSTGQVYIGAADIRTEDIWEAAEMIRWAQELNIPLGAAEATAKPFERAVIAIGDEELLLLLSLKGSSPVRMVAEIFNTAAEEAHKATTRLRQAQLLSDAGALGVRLSETGEQRATALITTETSRLGKAQAEEMLAHFTRHFDKVLKEIITGWQMRTLDNGEMVVNDHIDEAYDQGLLQRLQTLHTDVTAWMKSLPESDPFKHFHGRLERAIAACVTGNAKFWASPAVDSYHNIWFELHEYLIRLAGKVREE